MEKLFELHCKIAGAHIQGNLEIATIITYDENFY